MDKDPGTFGESEKGVFADSNLSVGWTLIELILNHPAHNSLGQLFHLRHHFLRFHLWRKPLIFLFKIWGLFLMVFNKIVIVNIRSCFPPSLSYPSGKKLGLLYCWAKLAQIEGDGAGQCLLHRCPPEFWFFNIKLWLTQFFFQSYPVCLFLMSLRLQGSRTDDNWVWLNASQEPPHPPFFQTSVKRLDF